MAYRFSQDKEGRVFTCFAVPTGASDGYGGAGQIVNVTSLALFSLF
jgi:hypothetical protein